MPEIIVQVLTVMFVPFGQPATPTANDQMDVCMFLTRLPELAGKTATVRGYLDHGLRSTRCSFVQVAGARWPAALSLESDAEADSMTRPNRHISFSKFTEQVRKLDLTRYEIIATFSGQITTRLLPIGNETIERLPGNGMGHLGAYPAKMIVYAVSDISIVPRSDDTERRRK